MKRWKKWPIAAPMLLIIGGVVAKTLHSRRAQREARAASDAKLLGAPPAPPSVPAAEPIGGQ